MTKTLRIAAAAALALALSAAAGLAQTPAPNGNPTPESVEELRRRAREEAERAREAAERARDAARQVREQEAELRRSRSRAAVEAERGPEVTETFSRTLRLGRDGTLDLSNIAGDIVVTGGGGEDVRIDAVKRVRQPSDAEARALLQELRIEVSDRGNYVEVRTEYPRSRRNFSGSVDYTIAVPTGATVLLNSVSGDIRVTNVRGGLRAESVSGNIDATSIQQLRGVRSVSGDIMLANVTGGDVTAGTVSGDAILRNVTVSGIAFEAVSGDLRCSECAIERAEVRTISGDVDFSGQLARSGRYRFTSQSGDIRVVPTGATGFDLDASSFSGTVRSNVQFRNNAAVQTPRRGPRTETLRGTFGDASAVITLRSFSGDVSVMRN